MKVFPVVHISNHTQATEQANVALSLGADGVFFIHHGMGGDERTIRLAQEFKHRFKDKVIGVNLLSMDAKPAIVACLKADIQHVWLDNAGIHSETPDRPLQKFISDMVAEHGMSVYAGAAFKYQKEEPDPAAAASQSMNAFMIPVTSGQATGAAADVSKVAAMAEATLGNLGVASGLTVDNIDQYSPYIKYAFVSTGVSRNDYEFEPDVLSEFIQKAHGKSSLSS